MAAQRPVTAWLATPAHLILTSIALMIALGATVSYTRSRGVGSELLASSPATVSSPNQQPAIDADSSASGSTPQIQPLSPSQTASILMSAPPSTTPSCSVRSAAPSATQTASQRCPRSSRSRSRSSTASLDLAVRLLSDGTEDLTPFWGADETPRWTTRLGFEHPAGEHPIPREALRRSFTAPSDTMRRSWDRVAAALDANASITICVIGGSSEKRCVPCHRS